MSDRDWTLARGKVTRERVCRLTDAAEYGDCAGKVEAAHLIARAYDRPSEDDPQGVPIPRVVAPAETVPLCTVHHQAYDAHEVDLIPFLTLQEQAAAVRLVGLVRALQRLSGGRAPLTGGSKAQQIRALRERMQRVNVTGGGE